MPLHSFMWYLTKASNDLLLQGCLLFGNERQYFTTLTIFSHIWIPHAATGSSPTQLVLQKYHNQFAWCKYLSLQVIHQKIFHNACKTLLTSQSVSIISVCRAPCNTWRPQLPMLIKLENSFFFSVTRIRWEYIPINIRPIHQYLYQFF